MKQGRRSSSGRKPNGFGARAVFALGFQLLFSALGGLILGLFFDRAKGTTSAAPLGLIVGLLAGLHRIYLAVRSAAGDGD